MKNITSAENAIKFIESGMTVAVGGAGAGHVVPDKILQTLGEQYQQNSYPENLTIINPCGIGDNDTKGLNHIALEGLVAKDFGGFWGNAPKMVQLAQEGKIQGYNLPQGMLSHMIRASAGREPGVITKTGLNTFVDPIHEGGKINEQTTEDFVQRIELNNETYLFYPSFKIDVAIIRGTSADKEGNLRMDEEVGTLSMLSLAQAAKANGGKVIAQVKRTIDEHFDPSNVKVPGIMIDAIVIEKNQDMTFISSFDPALVKRDVPFESEDLQLEGIKKIISKRAAMELVKGQNVNLGYGLSDGVPIVAQAEGVEKELIFLIEQGGIGGIPTTGLNFGAMYNPSAIIDDSYQFDFFHGGNLDIAFLGFAQIDQYGNINSSRFGKIITGCGGSIDISQHAKKVVYCGSFAVKGQIEITPTGLNISHPGKFNKFVSDVQQLSFNGPYAMEKNQEVMYVTERAVFNLTKEGMTLIEIAPGIDLQKDVLDMMDFKPIVADDLKEMATCLFTDEEIGLKEKFGKTAEAVK